MSQVTESGIGQSSVVGVTMTNKAPQTMVMNS